METVYDIWKTDIPPYYEVVVVCDACWKRPKDCECPIDETEEEEESI